jgi:CelD/BcsL family acetyltransferase involved in cellulose biosynthesis
LTEIIAPSAMLPKSTVSVELVTTVDGVAALGPCYEQLHRVTGNTLPFGLHEWHLAWVIHFLNCHSHIRDEPRFYVLRNAEGACVAILPFIVSRRRLGPLKIVSVDLLGADPAITEIRAPLIQPGYEQLTARAVHHHLTQAGHWDWIHWTGIDPAFAAALAVNGKLRWHPPQSDFVLDLAPSWEEFRLGLKRNIRESLRHCYNSLKREGHEFQLHVIDSLPELQRGLDQFFELHRMRADLKTAPAHVDRFATPLLRDFLRDVCERLCRRGALRIFQLRVGPQLVATRLGFVTGNSLYLYYSGFDPAWSRYSVMTTTVAEAIKYAIAQGLKTVSLSPAKDVSKTRWSARQVNYASAYENAERLRSRLASGAYLRARSGAGFQSRVLQRLISARRNWY